MRQDKKWEPGFNYEAVFNTGEVYHGDTKRQILYTIKDIFEESPEIYLAEVSYKGAIAAFIWRAKKGLYIVARKPK